MFLILPVKRLTCENGKNFSDIKPQMFANTVYSCVRAEPLNLYLIIYREKKNCLWAAVPFLSALLVVHCYTTLNCTVLMLYTVGYVLLFDCTRR